METTTKEAIVIYVDGEPYFNEPNGHMAATMVDLVCGWEGVKVITLEKIRIPA